MEEKLQHPRISVVIPALNEAQNLRHVISLISLIVSEVILVILDRGNDRVHK